MTTIALWYAAFGFGILGVAIMILWVLGLIDVLKNRTDLDRGQKSGWVLLIVLLPVVGTIYYFIRRPTLESEKEKMMEEAVRRHQR